MRNSYEEYKAVFGILQDDLTRQTKDRHWAHDYALQFLNRCMFLYFVQRKRWLGEDTEFLRSFWESYKSTEQPPNSFFDRWLKVLFFEAFNNRFHVGTIETPYNRKKRIIGQNLYGVDVMEWACHVAELRLWLALTIDTDFSVEELHVRREPLLPHFSFKIRCGDSLVQEIGGINLEHIRGSHDIPSGLKSRINKLKTEKLKFYNNDATCQFRSADDVIHEEIRLFRDVLSHREHVLQEDVKRLTLQIESSPEQLSLAGIRQAKPKQLSLTTEVWKKEREAKQAELARVSQSRAALKITKHAPFFWDIAFVEIFRGEKEGFDIVIGNPPYVRQEDIADSRMARDEVTTESKRAYKSLLVRSVYQAFPRFFGYKPADSTCTTEVGRLHVQHSSAALPKVRLSHTLTRKCCQTCCTS